MQVIASAAAIPDLALVRAVRWEAKRFVAQLEARGQFQVVYVRCIADKLKVCENHDVADMCSSLPHQLCS